MTIKTGSSSGTFTATAGTASSNLTATVTARWGASVTTVISWTTESTDTGINVTGLTDAANLAWD